LFAALQRRTACVGFIVFLFTYKSLVLREREAHRCLR